jgi:hypothetical protein
MGRQLNGHLFICPALSVLAGGPAQAGWTRVVR